MWAWLVRAARWSEHYENCKRLTFEDAGAGPDLTLGARFSWVTFGARVKTVVEELEAPSRLAWSGGALGMSAYHAWLIEPREAGCWILTEETQRGLLPRLGRALLRPRMHAWHQRWLEGLVERARSGPPEGG